MTAPEMTPCHGVACSRNAKIIIYNPVHSSQQILNSLCRIHGAESKHHSSDQIRDFVESHVLQADRAAWSFVSALAQASLQGLKGISPW